MTEEWIAKTIADCLIAGVTNERVIASAIIKEWTIESNGRLDAMRADLLASVAGNRRET